MSEHNSTVDNLVSGLFVPLHFCSQERKVHRENFRSRGTFVPWNIRSLKLSLLSNFHSSLANVPRTFVPWNIRSHGTNIPRTFVPMKLSFHENEYSKNFRSKCPKTRYKPYIVTFLIIDYYFLTYLIAYVH